MQVIYCFWLNFGMQHDFSLSGILIIKPKDVATVLTVDCTDFWDYSLTGGLLQDHKMAMTPVGGLSLYTRA